MMVSRREAGMLYWQIYCQKWGGQGVPGDGELQVFNNLLITFCLSVGSNPTLSATSLANHFCGLSHSVLLRIQTVTTILPTC
jgi:hypothetical protein